jgi:hypothetical protein
MLMKGSDHGSAAKTNTKDNGSLPTCIHCSGLHKLPEFTDLTDVQMGELHVQVELHNSDKGGILSQTRGRQGALRKNRLYHDTCTTEATEDQLVSKKDLTGVH